MKSKKYSVKGRNIKSITNIIKKEIEPRLEEVSNTKKTYFYVFEQYSFLQNSNMSGILLVDITGENECSINSIVAGGKAGFFQLDVFGREKSILIKVEQLLQRICKENNWEMKDLKFPI